MMQPCGRVSAILRQGLRVQVFPCRGKMYLFVSCRFADTVGWNGSEWAEKQMRSLAR